jgi:hypothetical protein
MRALAKRPEDRFQTATEMRIDLEKALAEDSMGEAETLRITRDVLSRMPKKSTQSTTKLSGIARHLEPTGDQPVAREETDLVAGGRRGRGLWIGLAVVVLAASAAVVLMLTRDKPGDEADGQKPAPQVKGPPPAFEPPGIAWGTRMDFPDDRLRILSVEARDANQVRTDVAGIEKRFADFLRQRGWDQPLVRPAMTIEMVPAEVLCREEVYKEGSRVLPGRSECKTATYWYRFTERTLLVVGERGLAAGLGLVMCLHSPEEVTICTPDVLAEFGSSAI